MRLRKLYLSRVDFIVEVGDQVLNSSLIKTEERVAIAVVVSSLETYKSFRNEKGISADFKTDAATKHGSVPWPSSKLFLR